MRGWWLQTNILVLIQSCDSCRYLERGSQVEGFKVSKGEAFLRSALKMPRDKTFGFIPAFTGGDIAKKRKRKETVKVAKSTAQSAPGNSSTWSESSLQWCHMSYIASQIKWNLAVCSTTPSSVDERKHQSSELQTFCEGNGWWFLLTKGQ